MIMQMAEPYRDSKAFSGDERQTTETKEVIEKIMLPVIGTCQSDERCSREVPLQPKVEALDCKQWSPCTPISEDAKCINCDGQDKIAAPGATNASFAMMSEQNCPDDGCNSICKKKYDDGKKVDRKLIVYKGQNHSESDGEDRWEKSLKPPGRSFSDDQIELHNKIDGSQFVLLSDSYILETKNQGPELNQIANKISWSADYNVDSLYCKYLDQYRNQDGKFDEKPEDDCREEKRVGFEPKCKSPEEIYISKRAFGELEQKSVVFVWQGITGNQIIEANGTCGPFFDCELEPVEPVWENVWMEMQGISTCYLLSHLSVFDEVQCSHNGLEECQCCSTWNAISEAAVIPKYYLQAGFHNQATSLVCDELVLNVDEHDYDHLDCTVSAWRKNVQNYISDEENLWEEKYHAEKAAAGPNEMREEIMEMPHVFCREISSALLAIQFSTLGYVKEKEPVNGKSKMEVDSCCDTILKSRHRHRYVSVSANSVRETDYLAINDTENLSVHMLGSLVTGLEIDLHQSNYCTEKIGTMKMIFWDLKDVISTESLGIKCSKQTWGRMDAKAEMDIKALSLAESIEKSASVLSNVTVISISRKNMTGLGHQYRYGITEHRYREEAEFPQLEMNGKQHDFREDDSSEARDQHIRERYSKRGRRGSRRDRKALTKRKKSTKKRRHNRLKQKVRNQKKENAEKTYQTRNGEAGQMASAKLTMCKTKRIRQTQHKGSFQQEPEINSVGMYIFMLFAFGFQIAKASWNMTSKLFIFAVDYPWLLRGNTTQKCFIQFVQRLKKMSKANKMRQLKNDVALLTPQSTGKHSNQRRFSRNRKIVHSGNETFGTMLKCRKLKKGQWVAGHDNHVIVSKAYNAEEPELKLASPPQRRASEPNYEVERHRVSSFRDCPLLRHRAQDLANSGLYLTPYNIVKCYSCFRQHPVREVDEDRSMWHFPTCHLYSQRSSRRQGQTTHGLDVVAADTPGRVSDEIGDPPGQQSVYIPPGDVRNETYRLSTFEHFPVTCPISRKSLAKSGFYFTGFFDRVKCFACGRTVERWEARDNPAELRWHKPDCPFPRGDPCGNIPINDLFNRLHTNPMTRQQQAQQQQEQVLTQTDPNTGAVIRTVRYPTDLPERIRRTGGTFEIGPGNAVIIQSGPGSRPNPAIHIGNETAPPPPRRWRMANVVSADHRRFLSNLYLNRELDRLTSFARWPVSRPNVAPAALARTGFFYLGDMDRTQCFSCGGVLRNWTLEDDAQEEHRTHFPSCALVQGTENRNVVIPEEPESPEDRNRHYPCRYPANPHMRSEAARLETFDHRWPAGRVEASAALIAQAGFFFLGERDRVKCWYCNGGLQNWEYDDMPWIEHAKWFPNCQFLLQNQGQVFVYRHLAMNPHLARPIIAKQEGATVDPAGGEVARGQDIPPGPNVRQPSPPPTIIDPQEEMRKKKEKIENIMKTSDVCKNVIAMGFSINVVRRLLEERVDAGTEANQEDIYESASALLDDVMKKEEEMQREAEEEEARNQANLMSSMQSSYSTNLSSLGAASLGPAPGSGRYNVSFYDDDEPMDDEELYGSMNGPASISSVASASSVTAAKQVQQKDESQESLQEQLQKIEEERMCKICFSNTADMVFIPCSHMICCMDCTQAIRQCPVCRTKIEKAIKTYVN